MEYVQFKFTLSWDTGHGVAYAPAFESKRYSAQSAKCLGVITRGQGGARLQVHTSSGITSSCIRVDDSYLVTPPGGTGREGCGHTESPVQTTVWLGPDLLGPAPPCWTTSCYLSHAMLGHNYNYRPAGYENTKRAPRLKSHVEVLGRSLVDRETIRPRQRRTQKGAARKLQSSEAEKDTNGNIRSRKSELTELVGTVTVRSAC